MTGDLLKKLVTMARPTAYLRLYKGQVIGQNTGTGSVTLQPENVLLPQLTDVPFLGQVIWQVLPGETVYFAFDEANAAFVLGPVGDATGAESVALGTTLQTFLNAWLTQYLAHGHGALNAPPTNLATTPKVVPNIQSSTVKVRP